MKPTNKRQERVLITGCSSGFGLYTAVQAAKAGYDVIATMRNLDKSEPLKTALSQAAVTATIDTLDILKPEQIKEIAEKYAPIDILVNNAGILITGSFLDLTEEESRTVFETDYFGHVNMIRAVAPQMMKQNSGRIINIASLAGLIGHPYNSAYGAAKHALIGYTKSIRVELAGFNIKVISIEPGYHKTEIIGVNANQSENFYNRKNTMFEWNRGFLRAMFDEIIPRAGQPKAVVEKIMHAMTSEKPKTHYVVGLDARFSTTLQWLGLFPWLERKIFRVIRRGRRKEIKRELQKKEKRKNAKAAAITSE